MKTKHILLLGLGSLTATAAIATPIALVNSDFGGGGKPTRIIVGNVNNDSATLEIPFSEKISSTKATVTLVYENKEEQVEAEIVNENNVTKVILTNLKPNTNYQIKEMKIDDKIINFKDSQFATKDNTLEQDVVLQPKEEQKLPKTVDKTDENKEESKKNEAKQEDKHEQGKNTKVEEPVVTPGVGAQEPAVSLPQQAESKEADNSATQQKEKEEPKDQTENSGPLSNIPEEKNLEQLQPEVQPEVKKQEPVEEKEPEVKEQKKSEEPANKNSSVIGNPSTNPPSNNKISPTPEQEQAKDKDRKNPTNGSGNLESNSEESNITTAGNLENQSPTNITTQTENGVLKIEQTNVEQKTLAQTSQNNSDTQSSEVNTDQTIANQGESQVANNQETDKSVTVKVGYWRVENYSTKNEELTNLIVKVINDLHLDILVISQVNWNSNGQKIVDELNKKDSKNNWKEITSSSNSKEKNKKKSQKSKITFAYNSDLVTLNSTDEKILSSGLNEEGVYVIPPVLLKFKVSNNKIFSIVSSAFNSKNSKWTDQKNKLEKEISNLTTNEESVVFLGDTSAVKGETISNYNAQVEGEKISGSKKSKNNSTIFTKGGSNFEVEKPTRFDLSTLGDALNIRNKPKHAPVYVDLKFN